MNNRNSLIMLFDSSNYWIGKFLSIQLTLLTAVIVVTNPQTKSSENILNGKHLKVMWVWCMDVSILFFFILEYFT